MAWSGNPSRRISGGQGDSGLKRPQGNAVVKPGRGNKAQIDVNDAEDGVEDEIRPAEEVARRSLALFAVVGTALGAPRDETLS